MHMPPNVSVVVPCFNEEKTILKLLDAVRAQAYPSTCLQVVIADGLSTDGTRQLVGQFRDLHPELDVLIVDNEKRTIPAALNAGIASASGEIIVRLDAHSMPYEDYVQKVVRLLEEGQGDNVGGVWEIRAGSESWIAESIAAAASHPLGAGDALYRLRPRAGEVDTVPFGSFKRSLIERIGRFDESLLSNEDYEFNARLRKAGGVVWLDPAVRSVYFARPSLGALARQYWRYGFWKLRMLRRYPETLRWRQALPPLLLASLLVMSVLSLWWTVARYAFFIELAVYAFALVLAGLQLTMKNRRLSLLLGFPAAVTVMHFSWAAGFIWSLFTSLPPDQQHG